MSARYIPTGNEYASLPDLDRNYSPQVEEENSSAVESEASSASFASSEAE